MNIEICYKLSENKEEIKKDLNYFFTYDNRIVKINENKEKENE